MGNLLGKLGLRSKVGYFSAHLEKIIALPSPCQVGEACVPGDYYQVFNQFLGNWLRKAGIPSIKGIWQKAEEEHRLWIFPTRKFILNKEEARSGYR